MFRTVRRPYWDLYDDGYDRPRFPLRLFDQHFGSGFDHDMLASLAPANRDKSGRSEVRCDRDKFMVNLDVQQFKPEELKVKTVDNFVVIEGKHEEKPDEHGYISRHFVRRYKLPEGAKPEDMQCNLSSDGVLQIQCRRAVKEAPGERTLPITQTGAPAMGITASSEKNTANGETQSGDGDSKME